VALGEKSPVRSSPSPETGKRDVDLKMHRKGYIDACIPAGVRGRQSLKGRKRGAMEGSVGDLKETVISRSRARQHAQIFEK